MAIKTLRPRDNARKIESSTANASNEVFVGAMIRELRSARNLTIQDLSASAGLSVGFLSRIERDLANPSVKALHDIADALGITVGWFFRPKDDLKTREHAYVVRRSARRKIVYETGIIDELLSPSLSGELELICSRFPPLSESGSEPYSHTGEEGGTLIKGSLELWIGEHMYLLAEGDSFTFPSTELHRYRNPSTTDETVVIWAITPPSY